MEINKLLDAIEAYISDNDCNGELDCAIDNHAQVFIKHNVKDYDVLEICNLDEGKIVHKAYLEDFIRDYYESVIESVCNVIRSYKE